MAISYLRFSDGLDTDTGADWNLARKNLVSGGLAAPFAAGDRLWISQAHDETLAAAVTMLIAAPGTPALPNELLCGNDASAEPTAMANTAHLRTATSGSITFTGSFTAWGLQCHAGSGASSANVNQGGSGASRELFVDSLFELANTSASSRISLGNISTSDSIQVEWIDCSVKFGNTGQGLSLAASDFLWNGGSLLAGTAPTSLIQAIGTAAARGGNYVFAGVDLSPGLGTSSSLLLASSTNPSGSFNLKFLGCTLPASWTGEPTSAALTDPGQRVELHKCMVGTVDLPLWVRDHYGDITYDAGVYRNSGSVDSTPYSLKFDTTKSNGANCRYMFGSLNWSGLQDAPGIAVWVPATGSTTFTIELLYSGAVWNSNDVVTEVTYLGAANSYSMAQSRSGPGSPVGTVTELVPGQGTSFWTLGGVSSARSSRINKTVNVQRVGWHFVRVRMYKPGAVLYVCGEVDLS